MMRHTVLLMIAMVNVMVGMARGFDLKHMLFGDGDGDEAAFGAPVFGNGAPLRGQEACSGYLCQDTQACVKTPIDCPCEHSTTKCPVGDWYTCIRGDQSCESLLS
ncbi:hypothetical protein BCR43DRAFT_486955 [Syncephalastrum racemosum]|uniref:Long chronological lifespan protein 2 n=1 Tax=Syncephalastrum racemosum TaxID=13706 RepID=A0A1X2HPZ4_SYNRA|nr:hypothetical protein BCR43DRAFT_486955 [Syncephalastrum racemosum]